MWFQLWFSVKALKDTVTFWKSQIHYFLGFFPCLIELRFPLPSQFVIELAKSAIEFEIFLLHFLNGIQALATLQGLGLQFFNNLIDIIIGIGHAHGILDNGLRQAQTAGDLKGIRATRNSLHKTIGRTQTRRIKLHTSILHPSSLNSISLELWIVGCCHSLNPAQP